MQLTIELTADEARRVDALKMSGVNVEGMLKTFLFTLPNGNWGKPNAIRISTHNGAGEILREQNVSAVRKSRPSGDFMALATKIQAMPHIQALTEEDIAEEIRLYREEERNKA